MADIKDLFDHVLGAVPDACHIQVSRGDESIMVIRAAAQEAAPTGAFTGTTVVTHAVDMAPAGEMIKAPLVGIFYTAPSPDAEAFVTEGQRVKKGDTLCIIEAMKLMNEIESTHDGIVERIIAQNGTMVEFGQPLFAIKAE